MSVQSASNMTMHPSQGRGLKIGVFDSGVGGLSVLQAIHGLLPEARLVYVADSANAPYGERDDAFISERCHAISEFLKAEQVDAIVVACNTATAVAVHSLRNALPNLPIVGVEPGIKPAIARSKTKRIGVMATPGTLASAKFKALMDRVGQEATLVLQPCPGLAKEIESGALDRAPLKHLIDQFCTPLRQAGVDTVVLGCTHYPFVSPLLQQALGSEVVLLDTAQAVARRTAHLLEQHPRLQSNPHVQPSIELWTTGDAEQLSSIAKNWLGWHLEARKVSA